jgi:hypothetical protein
METIKSIEKQIELAHDEVRECHKHSSKYSSQYEKLIKKRNAETKSFHEKIREIEKKFQPLLNKSDKSRHDWDEKNRELIQHIKKLELKKDWVKVKKNGEFTDDETAKQFLQYLRLAKHDSKVSIIKKKLSNGIQLIRKSGYYNDYSAYFFFFGTKLKAYWYRRKAEHQGDETVPFAWVNVEKLVEDEYKYHQIDKKDKLKGNQYLVEMTTSYYGSEFKKTRSPNLNKFKEIISAMTPEKMKNINLKNKENLKILIKESRW